MNDHLSARLWQAAIFAIVLFGLGTLCAGLFLPGQDGDFGLTIDTSTMSSDAARVATITPGGAADRAHIRVGDVLYVRVTPSFIGHLNATRIGDVMTVTDSGRTILLIAVPQDQNAPWYLIAIIVSARLAFFFVALLLIWRRPDEPTAQALALFLASFGAAINVDPAIASALWQRAALGASTTFFFILGGTSLLAFVARFPEEATHGARRFFARMALPAGIFGTFLIVANEIVFHFFTSYVIPRYSILIIPYAVVYTALIVCIFIALIDGYHTSSLTQRGRIRWVVGTLTFGFSGLLVGFLSLIFHLAPDIFQFAGLTILAVPFGLAYAILRHRILDIGFIVNRALVYTIVSIIIVVTFIIIETLANEFFAGTGRVSVYVQLATALGLGFSVRFIHTRVDHFVDDVLFKERHEADAALRRFAREAAHITTPTDLVTKSLEVCRDALNMEWLAWMAPAPGEFRPRGTIGMPIPPVSENDRTVLALRTWRDVAEPGKIHSDMPGELAFPMIVRGNLEGILVCGPKRNHEAYAPDERDTLAFLAHEIGIAMDSLALRTLSAKVTSLVNDPNLPPAIRTLLTSP